MPQLAWMGFLSAPSTRQRICTWRLKSPLSAASRKQSTNAANGRSVKCGSRTKPTDKRIVSWTLDGVLGDGGRLTLNILLQLRNRRRYMSLLYKQTLH